MTTLMVLLLSGWTAASEPAPPARSSLEAAAAASESIEAGRRWADGGHGGAGLGVRVPAALPRPSARRAPAARDQDPAADPKEVPPASGGGADDVEERPKDPIPLYGYAGLLVAAAALGFAAFGPIGALGGAVGAWLFTAFRKAARGFGLV